MDLIQFALSIVSLVCCVILFFCGIAFAVLLWKSSRSTQPRDTNSYQKRFLFFFFVGTICIWIWFLTQTLLDFKLIPPRGVLPVQIIGFVFVLTMAILMIYLAIHAIKNRNASRDNR
jgi:hypothetical protein